MKQQRYIKAFLLLALTLLITFSLGACNKENNDSDPFELSEGAQQVVELAKADVDAAFNYFLNAAEAIDESAENGEALINIMYISAEDGGDYSGGRMEISLNLSEFDAYYLCVCQNEADAQKWYDENVGAYRDEREREVVIKGNKVISDFTTYNKAFQYKRPSSITKFTNAQIKFVEDKLHRGVGTEELYTSLGCYWSPEDGADAVWHMELLKGNCRSSEGISPQSKDSVTRMKKFLSVNYTEDSYVNYDEKTGIVSYKLTEKPGWFVRELTNNGQPTGKYEASYKYKDVPTTLTIPAKVGGYDIDYAYVDISEEDATIDSVIIENAMREVELDGNIRQITIPVSNQAFVGIRHNRALLTINFNGSMEQWEALQLHALRYTDADYWTRAYYLYSSDYVDITFTVVCANGNIIYPKA